MILFVLIRFSRGGFNGSTRMNTGERYNPKTNTWMSIPDMYNPRSNFAVEVCRVIIMNDLSEILFFLLKVIDDYLFVIGRDDLWFLFDIIYILIRWI
jgi:hypothetical protein